MCYSANRHGPQDILATLSNFQLIHGIVTQLNPFHLLFDSSLSKGPAMSPGPELPTALRTLLWTRAFHSSLPPRPTRPTCPAPADLPPSLVPLGLLFGFWSASTIPPQSLNTCPALPSSVLGWSSHRSGLTSNITSWEGPPRTT